MTETMDLSELLYLQEQRRKEPIGVSGDRGGRNTGLMKGIGKEILGQTVRDTIIQAVTGSQTGLIEVGGNLI